MSINFLYSKNKVLKHLKVLDHLKKGKKIAPVLARIDLTNMCNHRCTYCMYQKSLPEFGLCDSFSFKDSIPEEDAFALIKNLKKWGVKAIMFAGGGEPTIHPNFKKIVKFCLDGGLEVGIITNGARIDNSWLGLTKRKNLKWIRISLDASNTKTWKTVHLPSSENSFKDIIQTVTFLKNRGAKTQIGASFVINDLNWKEIVGFTKLCKKNNFDDVRISFTYQIKREKLYSRSREKILLFLSEAKKFSDSKFSVNVLKERLESLELNKKNYGKCYFSYFSISIGADLMLYPCCMTKYSSKHRIADLRNTNFDKKFVKKWTDYIRKIDVKTCPSCWYDGFNEVCNYYQNESVDFENFIN